MEAGVQLGSHNPRKQRKNPAGAGSGERFRGGKWRRECNEYRTLSRVDGFGTGSPQKSAHQRPSDTRSVARRDAPPARTINRYPLANGHQMARSILRGCMLLFRHPVIPPARGNLPSTSLKCRSRETTRPPLGPCRPTKQFFTPLMGALAVWPAISRGQHWTGLPQLTLIWSRKRGRYDGGCG